MIATAGMKVIRIPSPAAMQSHSPDKNWARGASLIAVVFSIVPINPADTISMTHNRTTVYP